MAEKHKRRLTDALTIASDNNNNEQAQKHIHTHAHCAIDIYMKLSPYILT